MYTVPLRGKLRPILECLMVGSLVRQSGTANILKNAGAEAPRHPLPRLPAQWAVMLFCNSASLYDHYYLKLYDVCYPFISLLSSSNTGLLFQGAQTLSYNVNHYYLGS